MPSIFDTQSSKATPSGLAFSRNPIVLEGTASSEDATIAHPFTVKRGGQTVYSGRFSWPFCVNVAEIVDAFANPIPDPVKRPYFANTPFIMVEESDDIAFREFSVDFVGEQVYCDFGFFAFPGGISKQNFRKFAGKTDKDIFTARFLAKDRNFFLTTRTAGWRIVLKETELYPLAFISGEDVSIVIQDSVVSETLEYSGLDAGVLALDLERLRRKFFDEFDIIPNVFDVYREGKFACRIVIEEAGPARDFHTVKFRNSLGAFELMQLDASLERGVEWSDEQQNFTRYDKATDSFIDARDRATATLSFSGSRTVRTAEELSFLLDMLASDEVYLMNAGTDPIRVIPSTEGLELPLRLEAPQSVEISFTVVEKEQNFTPDITGTDDARRPRVFSKQFGKQFN